MRTDFIIVGQGLAGTLLSYELLKQGKTVAVIDSPDYQKASAVAAGLINPVVFRRLTKSWFIDELYPQLEQTYGELERLLGRPFYYPTKIRKVLGRGEGDFWKKKVVENDLANYLMPEPDDANYSGLNLEHGSGWVEKAGRVDLEALLNGYHAYLEQRGILRKINFDYDRMVLHPDRVVYSDLEADKIIFCEGYRVSQNPWFQQIRFRHTKGEVFNLETATYQADFILNKAFFLMPVGEKEFRMGATYDWHNLNEEPTTEALNELTGKLEQVFEGDYRLTRHRAGIRPTTHDRRPVLGFHPEYPRVGIFNGLGSKGCMLGPYFARQFAANLINKSSLIHPEVSLGRYS
jgi:glycine/D-amino acid oxidase-like deaminating enzyme